MSVDERRTGADRFEPGEGFTRLDRSRLWQINSDYWRARGHGAFQRDHVPFQATSDGALGAATAALIAAWNPACPLLIIEPGPGSGLFARGLLRRLGGYDAHYLGVDVAPAMARDIVRGGILAEFEHISFLELDLAGDLAPLVTQIADWRAGGGRVIVVGNYIFDSLPVRSFRRRDGALCELEIMVTQPADDDGPADIRRLLTQSRFVVCPDGSDDQFIALARSFVTSEGQQLTVNSVALDRLSALARAVGPDGLVLLNDYAIEADDQSGPAWQNFGGSLASGLHFAALDQFMETGGLRCIAPQQDAAFIHSRLIGAYDEALAAAYSRIFSLDAARLAHGRVAAARGAQGAGHIEQAAICYAEAVAEQPENWSILIEAAGFTLTVQDRPDEAAKLLYAALEENPVSPVAHNLLGDCHYRAGDLAAAETAYRTAETVSGGHARARLNLAYCAARADRLEDALIWIARALSADVYGELTGPILERQAEIVARIGQTGAQRI